MDIVSIGGVSIGAILLCLWFGFAFMPTMDQASKEREWSRPEREAARRRKKEEKAKQTRWYQYPSKKEKIPSGISRATWTALDDKTRAALERWESLSPEDKQKAREWAEGMFG